MGDSFLLFESGESNVWREERPRRAVFLLPLIAVVTLQHFVPMFSIGFDPILIGVVGAFGAVTLFLKHKKMISIAILAAALISSAVAHDPRGLTIVAPYILGMIGLKGYFESSASL